MLAAASSSAVPWALPTGPPAVALPSVLPLLAPRFVPPLGADPRLALPPGGARPAPLPNVPVGDTWQQRQVKSSFEQLKVALTTPPWIYVSMAFLMLMHTLTSSSQAGGPTSCGNAPCDVK